MKRLNLILIESIFLICCAINFCSCKQEEQVLKFAIASDFHAQDVPDGKERLEAFIQAAQDEGVDFIIELGDFCRLDSISQPLLAVWNKYPGESYHVLGNHDMDAYTPDEYVNGMGMPGRYYSFDKGDYHFIVLDGNNLYDGEKYTHYSKANYYVNSTMREFIDPDQMEWLKKDVDATTKKCILFSHQSIDKCLKNGEEVRRILEDANRKAGYKKVVMAFSGHNHSNYTEEINGISYMQVNSASYVWIDEPSNTEERYPEEINKKYSILKYSIPYDAPLFAIITLTGKEAIVKGRKANFMPPTPQSLGMEDSLGAVPLVSTIEDVTIDIR